MTLKEAIMLAKKGKSVGWSTIILSTFKDMNFLANKFSVNKEEALTVIHNTYVKALSSINNYNDNSNILSWLALILAKEAMEEKIKNNQRAYETLRNPEKFEFKPLLDPINFKSISASSYSDKDMSAIKKSLRKGFTTYAERMCIVLYYILNIPANVISVALNTTEDAVINTLNQAKITLNKNGEELNKINKNITATNASEFYVYFYLDDYNNYDLKEIDSVFINGIIENTAEIVAKKHYKESLKEKEEIKKEAKKEYEIKQREINHKKDKNKLIASSIILVVIVVLSFYFANSATSHNDPVIDNVEEPSSNTAEFGLPVSNNENDITENNDNENPTDEDINNNDENNSSSTNTDNSNSNSSNSSVNNQNSNEITNNNNTNNNSGNSGNNNSSTNNKPSGNTSNNNSNNSGSNSNGSGTTTSPTNNNTTTEPSTNAPSEPSTEAPDEPSTEPPTEAPVEPPTEAPAEETPSADESTNFENNDIDESSDTEN